MDNVSVNVKIASAALESVRGHFMEKLEKGADIVTPALSAFINSVINALLSAITIETVTQLNRPALPKLTRGPNRIQVRLGPQVETIQFQPSIIGGNHKKTVHSERGLDVVQPFQAKRPAWA